MAAARHNIGERMPPDIALRAATPQDGAAIAALHARVFGPGRFARSAYRLREGRPEGSPRSSPRGSPQASPFCRVAESADGLAGAISFTPVTIGGCGGTLLLGPLAVDPARTDQGIGRGLIEAGLDNARAAGIALVILVGDMSYYARLGFAPVPPGQICLPGPVDPARLLAAELQANAAAAFAGLMAASAAT